MKKLIIKILVLSTGLLLFSCGGGGDNKYKNVLHSAIPSKPKSLDTIAVAADLYSNTVAGPVYETLLSFDYFTKDPVLVPELAEALPDISADKLVYTFKIKKGIRYYDAEKKVFKESKREVLAKDFILSILRMSDLTLQGKGYWLIDGSIKGLNEWRDASADVGGDYDNIPEGLQAPDDYTLKITLVKPNFQLLYFFTMQYTTPLPQEYIDYYKDELPFHLMGTGAYYLDPKETIQDSIYVYKPNPIFRKEVINSPFAPAEEKGKQLPLNDGINISVIEESSTQWLKFIAGELDVNSPDEDSFTSVIKNKEIIDPKLKDITHLIISPAPDVTYNIINFDSEAWGPIMRSKNGIKVRQAIANVIDLNTEIDVLRNGRGIPSRGIIPPGIDGYDETLTPKFVGKDIAKAKSLLAEAGYPDGKGLPVLHVTTNAGSDWYKKYWELMSPNFKDAGFNIDIEFVDFPTLLSKLDDKSYEYAGLAWGADYPDGQNFLQLLYSKSSESRSGYKNEEFDRLYEQALLMEPSEERSEIYKKMNRIIVEEQAMFFGVNRIGYAVVYDWLKGHRDALRFLKSTAKYKYIDVDLKKSILESKQ